MLLVRKKGRASPDAGGRNNAGNRKLLLAALTVLPLPLGVVLEPK